MSKRSGGGGAGAPKTKLTKSKEVQLADIHQKMVFWDGVWGTTRTFITWIGVVGCAFCVYLSAKELAGRQTITFFQVLGEIRADQWIAYIVATVSSTASAILLRTNRRLAKQRPEYATELERRLDPMRTSSGLDETGKPRPEDKDGG